MADVKISALPLATTPLAGTEVLPIVQSATTDQVSVANLTAGRAVSALSLTLTGTPLAVGSGGTGLTSLTAGYIPFGAGTSAFGNDSNLFWDNTNKRLGIGTASPATGVDIYGGLFVRSGNSIRYYRSDNASYTELNDQGSSSFVLNNVNGDGFVFKAGSATTHMTLNSAGNLGLGNSSPSTYANGQGTTLVVGSSVNWATIQGRTDGPALAGNGVSYGGSYSTNPINGARMFVAASGAGGQQGQILFYTKNVDDNVTQPSLRMTLNASGQLLLGNTSNFGNANFQVYGANQTIANAVGNIAVMTTDAYAIDKGGSISFGGKYASDGSYQTFGAISGRKENSGDGGWAGYLSFQTGATATERMRLTSGGKLLVNTSNVPATVNIADTDFQLYISQSNADNGWLIACANADGNLSFYRRSGAPSNTKKILFDVNGKVIVGADVSTTATGNINVWGAANAETQYYIQKNTQIEAHFGFKSGSDSNLYVGTGPGVGVYGLYQANLSTAWTAVSDERVKDIIEPITNAVQKVDSLRAVIGKFKHDADGVRRVFLIAQDVQAVLPEAVDAADPDRLGLAYTDVIPLLVASIKELAAKVQALEAKI